MLVKTMSFQRTYAEPYDWIAQQLKDWAFTRTTSILYYHDYDAIGEGTRNLYRKAMAAFAGPHPAITSSCWKSRMQVDDTRPLRLCKHCQKVFMSSRANAVFFAAHGARTGIMFIKAGENIKNRMVTKMPESQNIEWKAGGRTNIWNGLCGYANAQGGKIYIGCDDEGNVAGLPNARRLLEDIPIKSGTRWALLSALTCWTRMARNISRSMCRRIPSDFLQGRLLLPQRQHPADSDWPGVGSLPHAQAGCDLGQSASPGFFAGRCGRRNGGSF